MSEFSDAFRLERVALKDGIVTELVTDWLLPREDVVSRVVASYSGADAALGVTGTQSIVTTEITPRPKLEIRDQWRSVNGVATKIGDVKATITRTITSAQLTGASWFTIGSVRYTIVQGETKRGPYEWTVVLKREAQ